MSKEPRNRILESIPGLLKRLQIRALSVENTALGTCGKANSYSTYYLVLDVHCYSRTCPILQMKGWWQSNINVWFQFMYFQIWSGAASLLPKQNYNVLFPNFQILISVTDWYIPTGSVCLSGCSKFRNLGIGNEVGQFLEIHTRRSDFRYSAVSSFLLGNQSYRLQYYR
jgi:hypothetical protein